MSEASTTDLAVTQTEESFTSQGVRCAATVYRPQEVAGPMPVVVMAHGVTLTRRDGIPAFARHFAATGCSAWPSTTATGGIATGTPAAGSPSAGSSPTGVRRWRSRASSAASTPAGWCCGDFRWAGRWR